MSHHVLLRAVVSSHEPSCHLMSRCVLSWAIMTLYELLCHLMRHHVISWAIVSFHEPSCHLMSRCVISWDIISSHEPLCHLMRHHVISWAVVSSHETSCYLMSRCVISWSTTLIPMNHINHHACVMQHLDPSEGEEGAGGADQQRGLGLSGGLRGCSAQRWLTIPCQPHSTHRNYKYFSVQNKNFVP